MNKQERERELARYNRLIRTLGIVNSRALKLYYAIVIDGLECEYEENNGLYTVELPSSDLFKRAYGKMTVTFNNKKFGLNSLVDIQPRQYLEDCHTKMPISYKGICIPDTDKDRFKVDLAIKMLNL